MSLLYRIQLNHVGKKNNPAYINFSVTLLRRVAQRKVTIHFQDNRGDRALQRPRKRFEITAVLVSEQNHFRCGFRADARAILYQQCRDSLKLIGNAYVLAAKQDKQKVRS